MKKRSFLFMFILFLACNMHAQNNISCTCISYNEANPALTHSSTFNVSPEEIASVPPLSETWVNYLSDYHLEEDSLGRVSKLIRTDHMDKSTQETTYIYDSSNRLIREFIHYENAVSESNFIYREEQILIEYDSNDRRIRKVHKVIYRPNQELVLEECTYSY